jgi:hypothetical protein
MFAYFLGEMLCSNAQLRLSRKGRGRTRRGLLDELAAG